MKQTNKVKVKLSYKDILGDLRGQPGNGQRIPYPVTTIMGKAGVSWEQIESLHPTPKVIQQCLDLGIEAVSLKVRLVKVILDTGGKRALSNLTDR